jgi:hypothetical protein
MGILRDITATTGGTPFVGILKLLTMLFQAEGFRALNDMGI